MEPVSPHLYSLPSAARARRSTNSLSSVLSVNSAASSIPAVSSPLASPILRASTRTPPSPILLSRTSTPAAGRIVVPPTSTRRVAQSNAAAVSTISPPATPPPVTYDATAWALLSIVRDVAPPSAAGRMLTVTLLHRPSEALFAWPLQTDPNAPAAGPGKVFITPRSASPEDAPTQAITSESLRVLGSVLGAWMRSRRRASLAGYTASSPRSSEESEAERETSEIAQELGFVQLTAQQRREALARQHVPEEELGKPASPDKSNKAEEAASSKQSAHARSASCGVVSTPPRTDASSSSPSSRPLFSANYSVASTERVGRSSSSAATPKSPKSAKSTLSSSLRLFKFGSAKRSPPPSQATSPGSSPSVSRRTSISSAASSVPVIEVTDAEDLPKQSLASLCVQAASKPSAYATESPLKGDAVRRSSAASVIESTAPLSRWGSAETIIEPTSFKKDSSSSGITLRPSSQGESIVV